MNLNDYQKQTGGTAQYPDAGTGRVGALAYASLGLAGEAGEIANKTKKVIRDDNSVLTDEKREQIAAELGDVLWYVARVATEVNIDLDEVAELNLVKLRDRQKRGVIGGSGDQR